jgi:hypothetical protein
MAKAGMRRPDPADPRNHGTEHRERRPNFPNNDVKPVPEIQGKAKTGNKKANPT